jgi:hypothetical protein
MMNLENHHSHGKTEAKRDLVCSEEVIVNRQATPVAENHQHGCDPSGPPQKIL